MAMAEIRQRIRSGWALPGTPLRQEVLAQELQVSRTVVKEALFVLTGQGWVEHYARLGFIVAQLSPRDVEAFYTTWLAGLTWSDPEAQEAKGQKLLAEMANLQDMSAWWDLDQRLHQVLTPLAASLPPMPEGVVDAWIASQTLLHVYRRHAVLTTRERRRLDKQHEAIYSAWSNGSIQRAESLLRAHFEAEKALVLSMS